MRRQKFGHYGQPLVPGCRADKHTLGWVPGMRYRIWTRQVDLCLGYSVTGEVIVRGEDGTERRHSTPVSAKDLPQGW